jgi:hypothetical protein
MAIRRITVVLVHDERAGQLDFDLADDVLRSLKPVGLVNLTCLRMWLFDLERGGWGLMVVS